MTPSAIASVLPKLIERRRPVFLWGKPGIGKSSVVNQVVAAMSRMLNDVRLSQLDSIDLRGFPVPDMKSKRMEWLPASFLPAPNAKPGVLFLDEFNGAMPAVMSPAYQLILEHRIGDYVLPANWSIIAAGNGGDDRGITHQMPAPLNNRFVHIDFELDAADWQRRAADDGIHPHIRAYLRMKPGSLHVFDSVLNPRSFPTPRSWYFVNELYSADFPNQDLHTSSKPSGELFQLIAGTIGEGAAAEFIGFIRDIKDMPDIDSIMMDPKNAKLPGSQSVMHAVVTTLVDKTKASNFGRLMSYIERLPVEFQLVFTRGAIGRDSNVTSCKEYSKWALANQNVIM